MTREDRWYLASCWNLGSAVRERILREAGGIDGVFAAPDAAIRDAAFLSGRQKEEILRVRREASGILRDREKWERMGMRFLSREDPAFPGRLREIPDPPAGIFVIGSLPSDRCAFLAIVGARKCSPYGEACARTLSASAARAGAVVVSGMAAGIDGIAQQAALASGTGACPSIAVLAGGADRVYPAENRGLYRALCEKGAVISENPPGTVPAPFRFPQRNRLIAGLSDTVLVVEARAGSGSLITADQALEQGRSVLAVPGNIFSENSEGCNRLIRQGAVPICSERDLLEELRLMPGEEPAEEEVCVTGREYDLISLFPPRGETVHFEDLLFRSRYPSGDLSLLLLHLEQAGLVRAERSGFYQRTGKKPVCPRR